MESNTPRNRILEAAPGGKNWQYLVLLARCEVGGTGPGQAGHATGHAGRPGRETTQNDRLERGASTPGTANCRRPEWRRFTRDVRQDVKVARSSTSKTASMSLAHKQVQALQHYCSYSSPANCFFAAEGLQVRSCHRGSIPTMRTYHRMQHPDCP